MATIAYVVQAINKASSVLNDIATSAAKLDAAMDAAQRTADRLNTTLAMQNTAAQAASAGLESVARSAYAASAAMQAYKDSLKDTAAATVASGAAAAVAYRGYSLLWGLLGGGIGRTNLFGGSGVLGIMASVGAVHLLVDVVAEFLAVAIPASIALAAFGALGGPIFVDLYNNLVNVQKVVTATGQQIYPFTNSIASLQNSVKPEVYRLYGDALVVAGAKTKELGTLAIGTGTVLDNFGNRVAAALTSGGMSVFLKSAVQDVQRLGMVVSNVFGTIGNLLHSMPGYAAVLLNALKGVTGFAESVTGSGFVQGLAKVGLAAHGAVLYIGLLGTAAGYLTRVGLVGVSRVAYLGEEALFNLGLGGTAAAAGLSSVGEAAGAASAMPWAWIGIAAAAVGILVFKLVTAKSAAQSFVAALNTKLQAAPAAQGLQDLALGVKEINAQIAALGKAPPSSSATVVGRFAAPGNMGLMSWMGNVAAYKGELVTIAGQTSDYNQVVGKLAKTYGSVQVAQLLVAQSGLTWGQITSKNASQQAQDAVAYAGVADQLKAANALTNQNVIVMGRLNGVNSEAVTDITALNQAWDSYLAAVTGSQTGFDTYVQDFRSLNTASKASRASMDGVNKTSIALNSSFETQVTQTGALIDSWRLAGVTGSQLAAGVRNAIAPMTKFAGGSKEATAQLVALASEAGYQGPETLKALSGWLGITHDNLKKVKEISDQATIQEALLTSAFQGQGSALANTLIGDLQTTILKYSGVYDAVVKYGKALATQGSQSTAAHTARQQLIQDIVNAGKAAHDTQGQIAAMIAKVLKIPLHRALEIVVGASGSWKISGSTYGPQNKGAAPVQGAAGMMVRGGTPGVDSVPILAMPGELVVPKHLVDAGAVGHLHGMIPGYAAGGVVGSYSSSGPNGPSGLGTFTQQQYNATVSAVASATAAATAAGLTAAMSATGPISGSVISWLRAALAIDKAPSSWLPALARIVSLESGGNPRAYNPSGASGLMQMMPGTYAEFARGGGGIMNPISNAAAAIRYIEATYGSPFGIPNLYSGHYLGYDTGGILPAGLTMAMNATGAPERVVGPAEDAAIVSRLDKVIALLDELCDIAAGGEGNVSAAVSGTANAPLAGAAGRLAGYKQMFSTRG